MYKRQPQIERIRNSFHRKRSGDLLIEILPGWTIMQENSTDNRVVPVSYTHLDNGYARIFMINNVDGL